MKWIYISPHLDDAVLSAGGLIFDQVNAGERVEIWTILCGQPPDVELSPYAQLLHYQWGVASIPELIRARRAEDEKACQFVGVTPVYFNFLDCIYRRGKNGDWLYDFIFAPPHEEESDFPTQIAESLAARLNPTDQLVCQLGLGSHVDHVIVRHAVELLRRPLLYYADVPYLFKTPDALAPIIAGMKTEVHPVSEPGLYSWQKAVEAYESQINSLFDDLDHMRSQIRNYWEENGGIPLYALPQK